MSSTSATWRKCNYAICCLIVCSFVRVYLFACLFFCKFVYLSVILFLCLFACERSQICNWLFLTARRRHNCHLSLVRRRHRSPAGLAASCRLEPEPPGSSDFSDCSPFIFLPHTNNFVSLFNTEHWIFVSIPVPGESPRCSHQVSRRLGRSLNGRLHLYNCKL